MDPTIFCPNFIFIKSLKNGIHTIIGEEGIRVSGGEAQRINIARTIYLNRKFIFFDESLNNLDMITSNKILQNFKELDDLKTIFFITHDLRLLSDFEEVLVFNDGNLVENGSFSKLKSESKLFNTVSIGVEIFLKSGLCSNSHSLMFPSIHSPKGIYIS